MISMGLGLTYPIYRYRDSLSPHHLDKDNGHGTIHGPSDAAGVIHFILLT